MLKKSLFAVFLIFFSLSSFAQNNPLVRVVTNQGGFEIELDKKNAPISVENFMQYAKGGFYSGTVFHRVIKGFMIQGGGFTQDLVRKTTQKEIENEATNGLKNDYGTIAMARTNMPHSASAQFFINTAKNDFLNHTSKTPRGWGYAVFGKVTKGIEVISAIDSTRTGPKGMFNSDVPVKNIVIEKVEVISE